MIGADLLRAAVALTLVTATGSLVMAYAVAFGLSAGAVVFNPAAGSLLPEVVGDDEVIDANTAMWTAAVTAQIALAPVAGFVIAAFGVEIAFIINAATFIVSALLLSGLRAGRAPAETAGRGWNGVLAGVRTVRADPLLTRLALVQVLASMSAGATSGLLVVLADRWLGVGPGGFGTLLAAIGVGAAAGPLLSRRFINAGDKRWLFGPFAVRGGVDLTLAAVANPVVAAGALAVYGMSTSTGMIAYQTTLQTLVPADTRGRAFAFYDVLWNSARVLSLALGGVLVDLRCSPRLRHLRKSPSCSRDRRADNQTHRQRRRRQALSPTSTASPNKQGDRTVKPTHESTAAGRPIPSNAPIVTQQGVVVTLRAEAASNAAVTLKGFDGVSQCPRIHRPRSLCASSRLGAVHRFGNVVTHR